MRAHVCESTHIYTHTSRDRSTGAACHSGCPGARVPCSGHSASLAGQLAVEAGEPDGKGLERAERVVVVQREHVVGHASKLHDYVVSWKQRAGTSAGEMLLPGRAHFRYGDKPSTQASDPSLSKVGIPQDDGKRHDQECPLPVTPGSTMIRSREGAAQGRARGGDGEEEPAGHSTSSVGPTGLAQNLH